MTKTKKAELEKNVMSEIKTHDIKMRPKLYFVAGSILLGIGFTFALLSALFFIAVAAFHLREHGPFGYLFLGHFGIRPFIMTVPWIPIVLAIIGITGGVALLKKHDISYKKSFAGIVIALITTIGLGGFLIDYFGVTDKLQNIYSHHMLYDRKFVGEHFVEGEIVSVEKDTLYVSTPNDENVEIVLNEKTKLPFGKQFEEGERIRAVGYWEGSEFVAKGIGKGGLRWRTSPMPKEMMRNMMKEKVKGVRDKRLKPS